MSVDQTEKHPIQIEKLEKQKRRAMELLEIATEKEKIKEDGEASKPIPEVKTEEEAVPDHYSVLLRSPEDIYAEALFSDSTAKTKTGKQTEGNPRLYRAGCVFLTIICLVLLFVIIILALKLQTGSTVCTGREETTENTATACNYDECQAHITTIQPYLLGCQQCAEGWVAFERSCFYLSTFRLSWDKSQMNCTARGGSLATISSQRVQRFLTKKGNLQYWIGLRNKMNTWTWANNTVLQTSYWEDTTSEGDCVILNSDGPANKNWIQANCRIYTYFICELQF